MRSDPAWCIDDVTVNVLVINAITHGSVLAAHAELGMCRTCYAWCLMNIHCYYAEACLPQLWQNRRQLNLLPCAAKLSAEKSRVSVLKQLGWNIWAKSSSNIAVAVLGTSARQPTCCTVSLRIMHATPLAGLFVSNDSDSVQHDR